MADLSPSERCQLHVLWCSSTEGSGVERTWLHCTGRLVVGASGTLLGLVGHGLLRVGSHLFASVVTFSQGVDMQRVRQQGVQAEMPAMKVW